MKLKIVLFLLVVLTLLGCSTDSSEDSDSPEDLFWGYAKNDNLSLKIEQVLESSYTVTLSQNGNVYVTTDGTEPSVSNYKYHYSYDYWQGVSPSDKKIYLSDVWEANIRVLGIADGYPTENKDGLKIIYDPPVATEGTMVTFSKLVVIKNRSAPTSSGKGDSSNILVIPEWGTASCYGSWSYALGGAQRYYIMEAGTTGTLRFVKKETNTGSFSAYYMDDSPLTDGDAITAGTRFYLHARQGDKWSNDPLATLYSFEFSVEE